MTRYHFDLDDGTVDEIDPEEELRREEARGEAAAEEYEAFLEREYAMSEEDRAAKYRAELRETEYWNELERRKWELAGELLAQAYGEEC